MPAHAARQATVFKTETVTDDKKTKNWLLIKVLTLISKILEKEEKYYFLYNNKIFSFLSKAYYIICFFSVYLKFARS